MIVIVREIRSRVGDEECVLTALRRHAGVLLRKRHAEAVVVCERAGTPHDFLWIQHFHGSPRQSIDREDPTLSLEPGRVVSLAEAVRGHFVDGVYRCPLPPCRLWRVETCDEAVRQALLQGCWLAPSDERICGMSIYRTIANPSQVIGFLALVPGVAPSDIFIVLGGGDHADSRCEPLRVAWSVGRLRRAGCSVPSRVRSPRAAVWARIGLDRLAEAAMSVGR